MKIKCREHPLQEKRKRVDWLVRITMERSFLSSVASKIFSTGKKSYFAIWKTVVHHDRKTKNKM